MDDYKVKSTSSLYDALRLIEESGHRLCFVEDPSHRIVGILSDGDIRRHLIKNGSLLDSCATAMNHDFIYLNQNHSDIELDHVIGQCSDQKVDLVPILNETKSLVDIYISKGVVKQKKISFPVVIMAGGKGTRLKPFTESCPKPMLPVNGKPIIHHIIDDLLVSGFSDFYLSVNYKKEQLKEYFGDGSSFAANIMYLEEDQPLGTAGSLGLLPESLTSPILVINGDVRTHMDLSKICLYHQSKNSNFTVCTRTHCIDIPFGVINHVEGVLSSLEEKPSVEFLINAGIYVISPTIYKTVDASCFMDMTDLIQQTIGTKKPANVFNLENFWLDVGRPEDYLSLQQMYANI